MQSIKDIKKEKTLNELADGLSYRYNQEIELIANRLGASGQELAVRITSRLCDMYLLPGPSKPLN